MGALLRKKAIGHNDCRVKLSCLLSADVDQTGIVAGEA